MTLSPKLGVVEISTMAFQTPIANTNVYKGSFFPQSVRDWNASLILWSHLLKMQRTVLLSSLLWWELRTNSLITGHGEWLSFLRFTSKLSWSWSHELVGRFQPDLHGYNIETWWRADLVLVTLTCFSRSVWDCQIWAKKCLCAQYLMNQVADFNQICMDITFGHDKKLNRFWWPWSNFQGHCHT